MLFVDSVFGDMAFLGEPVGGAALEVEITLLLESEFNLYVGTEEFTTRSTDSPPSTPFRGTIAEGQALTFRRSILGGARIGDFSAGYGDMVLVNADGGYDFLIKRFAADGRRAVIKGGFADQPYDQFFTVFNGLAADWAVNAAELRVKLRDPSSKLDLPAQPTTYVGTGGAEGSADLAGKGKPLAFGELLNVAPPLLVPASLVYQLNDGPVQSIDAVYDGGLPLDFGADHADLATLLAATIAPGDYDTCLAAGLFRLGASPAGQVTADLHGDKTGGTYVNTVADIVKRLVLRATALTSVGLVAESFAAIATAQPAAIGYWIGSGEAPSVAEIVGRLMTSVGGWASFRRDGLLEIGIFAAPDGPPVDRIVEDDVLDIDRDPLPSGLTPPPFRFRVAYQRNWTVQTSGLAAGVTDARRAFVAEPVRVAEASDTAIKLDHPLAQDPAPVEAFFVAEAAAQAEAARLLALYRNVNSLYRIELKGRALLYELGQDIHVTYSRFDLTEGRLLAICELDENITENRFTIVGFG